MGLDITAYRKLTLDPDAKLDADGQPENDAAQVNFSRAIIGWTEDNFPGRTAGIEPGTYTFSESHCFRAGSYSGYNEWRRWLAEIVGLNTPQHIWDSENPQGPFVELINFADNEGVIGPTVSAKLAKDFAAHEARIAALACDDLSFDPYNLVKYREWRKAFEMAADGGAVEFH